jgi:hypothetical protein
MPVVTYLESDPPRPIATTHDDFALPDVPQYETYTQGTTAIRYPYTKHSLGSGTKLWGEPNREARLHRRLVASSAVYEEVDPSFRVQKHGFFKVGKVFKMLWPEPAGDRNQSSTIVTTHFLTEARVYCKVRWFVVVRTGQGCCTCL